MKEIIDGGSFRDPSGHVFHWDNRVFRTVTETGRAAYEATRDNQGAKAVLGAGRVIDSGEVEDYAGPALPAEVAYVLEHPRLPFISYPYEWSFSQLRAAALHHLDLQIELLEHGLTLSDASAYNIQFIGPAAVFIDRLSIVPYKENQLWLGYRQFCVQFLNPLLLRALIGIPHNAWYRGALEGIASRDLAMIIPPIRKLSWNIFAHVVLQARLDARAQASPEEAIDRVKRTGKLSRAGYEGILRQLRNWIVRLRPAGSSKSTWGDYARHNTYSDSEAAAKKRFVAEFSSKVRPATIVDLGCNTGDYSVVALENGAGYAIGFDFDHNALDAAFSRARAEDLRFLPLWLDAANPSPDQGWAQHERHGFASRCRSDAVLALAFEHHLAVARNIPLAQIVDWLVDMAPEGIIEFVPKSDPTIQRMLALREDIFPNYDQPHFEAALVRRSSIVRREQVSETGRILYWYSRQR